MTASNFAYYLKKRLQALRLTTVEAAHRSGLSRQTWYKLLRADVEEARLGTINKVAITLQTTPEFLISLYYQAETPCSVAYLPDSHLRQNMRERALLRWANASSM